MKFSFFGFYLLETHAQRKWTLDILFYNRETEIKRTLFGHFDEKQKCSVFTFSQTSDRIMTQKQLLTSKRIKDIGKF